MAALRWVVVAVAVVPMFWCGDCVGVEGQVVLSHCMLQAPLDPLDGGTRVGGRCGRQQGRLGARAAAGAAAAAGVLAL